MDSPSFASNLNLAIMPTTASGRLPVVQLENLELVDSERLLSQAAVVQTG